MAIERPDLAQSAFASALTLAALVLLALVLAYWTWVWLAPLPEPRLRAFAEPARPLASSNALFGNLRRNQGPDSPAGNSIELLGVVAAKANGPGYAVLRLDARQILAVRAGEEVAPGLRLEKVLPDRVILERKGARETLAWPERGKPLPSLAPGAGK